MSLLKHLLDISHTSIIPLHITQRIDIYSFIYYAIYQRTPICYYYFYHQLLSRNHVFSSLFKKTRYLDIACLRRRTALNNIHVFP